MVKGLEIKYSVCLIPVTMLCWLTASLNPIIKLECIGPYCRSKMHSKFDTFINDNYNSYDEWRISNTTNLQSDGTVTLLKLTHGFVECETNCDDCEGKKNAIKGKENYKVKCEKYNDPEYKDLLVTLEKLRNLSTEGNVPPGLASYNWTLPSWLKLDCQCKDWCTTCDDHNMVSLPGVQYGNNTNHTIQNFWFRLEAKYCKTGKNNDTTCKLFSSFSKIMILTVIGFVWLGAVLVFMMFVEYINFHIFWDGKFKFCFCTARFKKLLFTVLLIVPFSFMLYIATELLWLRKMDALLNDYFENIGATFNVTHHDTYPGVNIDHYPGVIMFYISIGFAFLSILATMLSGTTPRHLRTIINYRRGVEYDGVSWKPHVDNWKPHMS